MTEIIENYGTFTSYRGTFSLTRQRRPRTLADEYEGISTQDTVQTLVLTIGSLAHEVSVATDYSKDAEIGLAVAAKAILQTIATRGPDINAAADYMRWLIGTQEPWPIPVLGPGKAQYNDPLPKPRNYG